MSEHVTMGGLVDQIVSLTRERDEARAHVERSALELKSVIDFCVGASAGACPPDWSSELYDACELKEEAFDAGYARGAWVAYRAVVKRLQGRLSDEPPEGRDE